MDKKTQRTGEQRPCPRDRKIGNKMRLRKFYKEKERCQIHKVWKITKRKEGHVNKEHVQDIIHSGIVVKYKSTNKKK